MRAMVVHLSKWCAYSYMFKVFSTLIRGGDLSEQGKTGRRIALLGIFCPLFWYALFTGASKPELVFHASHSSIVFLIGLAIMIASLRKPNK
ncbi:hypothetical protein [Vibrio superstes]|uniref:Uncharacterized protein n=1 Tax=Vibrio superstes NBRC 103154 TaxID=1219062 RepID=A0A511QP73_9VIBR|nr:hypothetical protein [Vibrio superstes]GEM79138.1 hypothetical protein VSU01S_13830 [Vibrio superstes NBRC 103154]